MKSYQKVLNTYPLLILYPSIPEESEKLCQALTGMVADNNAVVDIHALPFISTVDGCRLSAQVYVKDVTIQKYLTKNNIEYALVFVKDRHTYQVHYPFNVPFANPHIYAKYIKDENKKLADKFPDYRYFIADENDVVVEVSMDEL